MATKKTEEVKVTGPTNVEEVNIKVEKALKALDEFYSFDQE